MATIVSGSPANLFQIAAQHMQTGRLREAEAIFRQILTTQPHHPDALFHLALLLMQQPAKYDEAIMCYRMVIALNPNKVEAFNNLGGIYFQMRALSDALECFQQALALRPNNPEARNNIGNVLKEQGKPTEALDSYRKALKRKPGDPIVLNNMGEAYRALNCYDDATVHFRKALAIKSHFPQAQWNLGLIAWMQGDLAAGFRLYEKRFDVEHRGRFAAAGIQSVLAKFVDKKRWKGESLSGKTLVVWTEQGMGDSLMMMRYLPLLDQKNVASVIVYCEPELVKVMHTVASKVVSKRDDLPLQSFDLHCPMMSLPHAFGTTVGTIPANLPYLATDAALSEKWASKLSATHGLKVGLVWSGNKNLKNDHLRSFDLERLAPLMALRGVHYISLQKGESSRQLQTINWPVLDWMDSCDDFMDTAALVDQLDLIISVDTSVAHLAGALGKPIWLLNRYESEWRWMLERDDSPWYPSMRIFRQPALHDWDSVIQMVASELAKLIPARRNV